MCLAQGPQRSDAGEARTRGPSVSSQALYHWATALPPDISTMSAGIVELVTRHGGKGPVKTGTAMTATVLFCFGLDN